MAGRNVNVYFGEPVRGGIQDGDLDPSWRLKKNAVPECSVKMEMEDPEELSFHQVTLPEGGDTSVAESFETDPLAVTSEDMKPCIVGIKQEKDFGTSQGLKGNTRTECFVKMETEDTEVPAFYQISLAEADASFMMETSDSDPLAVTSADTKPAIVGIKTDPVDPLEMKNNTSVEAVGIAEESKVLPSAAVNRPCGRPSVNICQRSSVICTLLDWRALSSSFGGRIVRGLITSNISMCDPLLFLEACLVPFLQNLHCFLEVFENTKIYCSLETEFMVEAHRQTIHLSTPHSELVNRHDNWGEWFAVNVSECIAAKFSEFSARNGFKKLSKIMGLHVDFHAFEPLYKGSGHIPLPLPILRKRAVVNVKNEDNKCFLWALASALFHRRNPSLSGSVGRLYLYRHIFNELHVSLNLRDLSWPFPVHQVSKFEKLNPQYSFNIYTLVRSDDEWVVRGPLYFTRTKRRQHFNFLLLTNGSGDSHYCWIRSFSRLFSTQLSGHAGSIHACDRCLKVFRTSEKLQSHIEDCDIVTQTKTVLPSGRDTVLKYKGFRKQFTVPFVVYVDFEVLISSCTPEANSRSVSSHHFEPFAVAMQVICSFDASRNRYLSHRGADCGDWLLDQLSKLAGKYQKLLDRPAPLNMTKADEISFRNATTCHICDKPLGNESVVRKHCRFSGKYCGAAHESCKFSCQVSSFIPVYTHNSSNYANHFILVALSKESSVFSDLKVIPSTDENFAAFNADVGNITFRFLDSMNFFQSSLDELISGVRLEDLKFIRNAFDDDVCIAFPRRKEIFPYDYISDLSKLEETSLPDKDKFYSRVHNTHISESEYSHAQNVWRVCSIQNLGEYADLCLKINVLLLTDVFELLRNLCRSVYNLDPCNFYTTRRLSWEAMLKVTGVSLDLLTDVDMLLFFEKMVRGGMVQVTQRHAEANNKYMGGAYDPAQPDFFLWYLNVCNFHEKAMSLPLPTGDFEWLDTDRIQNFDLKLADADVDRGYVLEVDLHFPEDIHDALRDLPPCPERVVPPRTGSQQEKSIASLFPRRKYVLQLKNVIQAVDLGVQLVKIHRGVSFRQSCWLTQYLDLNTYHRERASSVFEEKFFELQNRLIYEKFMEDERLCKRIYLVRTWGGRYGARRLIADPAFITSRPISGDLMTIELRMTEVKLREPIYVGHLMWEYCKFHVYDFLYNFLKKELEAVHLLYVDTDSLILSTPSDVYAAMARCPNHFDTSNFPSSNRMGITPQNKKVVGVWKDECGSDPLVEFVGLRPKVYAFSTLSSTTSFRAKVQRSDSHNLSLDQYKSCLFSIGVDVQQSFCQKQLEISSSEVSRAPLRLDDDTRFWIDRSTSYPWGHFRIPPEERASEKETGRIGNAACTMD